MAGFSRPGAPTRSSFIAELLGMWGRSSGSGRSNRGRLLASGYGSLGADDALLQQDIAIEPAFAGLDDGVGTLHPLVEGKALDEGELHRGLVLFDQRVEILVGLLTLVRVADDLHGKGLVVDI